MVPDLGSSLIASNTILFNILPKIDIFQNDANVFLKFPGGHFVFHTSLFLQNFAPKRHFSKRCRRLFFKFPGGHFVSQHTMGQY